MDSKKSKTYEIYDLLSWNENSELNISPKYQRNPVWDDSAKSFLIDTIMRNYPMPPLFFRQTFNFQERKTMREVIDGQQRSRAIIGFYNNEFPILKKHNEEYGGRFYRDLDESAQESFLRYNIFVDIIPDVDDSVVFDIFARMNSNGANVNKQEIRNAKYWGEFRTSVYSVTSNIRDFFLNYGVFTNKKFSRMRDFEFVSSLFILTIEGCNNETPSKIDKYYRDYDKSFPNSKVTEDLIILATNYIENIFKCFDEPRTVWRSPTYLYDLYALFLLSKGVFQLADEKYNKIELLSVTNVASILSNLNYELESLKESNDSNIDLINFEKNHRVHATSKVEREERLLYILKRGVAVPKNG